MTTRPEDRPAGPGEAGGEGARGPVRAPALVAACLGAFAAVLTGLVVAHAGPVERLDSETTTWLTTHVRPHPALVDLLQGVTDGLAPWTFRVLVLAVAVVLAVRGQHRLAVWALIVTWGGGLLVSILKVLVGRERPDLADPLSAAAGYAYPSGHALGATVGCAVLLALVRPGLGRRGRLAATVVAVTLAGLVSFTRVALGVHHLSDVTGGILLGVAWFALVTALVRPVQPRRDRP